MKYTGGKIGQIKALFCQGHRDACVGNDPRKRGKYYLAGYDAGLEPIRMDAAVAKYLAEFEKVKAA